MVQMIPSSSNAGPQSSKVRQKTILFSLLFSIVLSSIFLAHSATALEHHPRSSVPATRFRRQLNSGKEKVSLVTFGKRRYSKESDDQGQDNDSYYSDEKKGKGHKFDNEESSKSGGHHSKSKDSSSKTWNHHGKSSNADPTDASSSSASASSGSDQQGSVIATTTVPVLATWSLGSSTWTATQGWTTSLVHAVNATSTTKNQAETAPNPTPTPSSHPDSSSSGSESNWRNKKARVDAMAIASASSKAVAAAALATAAVGSTDPAAVAAPVGDITSWWLMPNAGQVFTGNDDVVLAWRASAPPPSSAKMQLCLLLQPDDIRLGRPSSCGEPIVPSVNSGSDGLTYSISFSAPNITKTDSFYVLLQGLMSTAKPSDTDDETGKHKSSDGKSPKMSAPDSADTNGWTSLGRERRRNLLAARGAYDTDSKFSNAFVLAPYGTDLSMVGAANPAQSQAPNSQAGQDPPQNDRPKLNTAAIAVPSVLCGAAVLLVGALLVHRHGRQKAQVEARDEADRLRRAEEDMREKMSIISPASLLPSLIGSRRSRSATSSVYRSDSSCHSSVAELESQARQFNRPYTYSVPDGSRYTQMPIKPRLAVNNWIPTLSRHGPLNSQGLYRDESNSSYASSHTRDTRFSGYNKPEPVAHPCYNRTTVPGQHGVPYVTLTSPTETSHSFLTRTGGCTCRDPMCPTDQMRYQEAEAVHASRFAPAAPAPMVLQPGANVGLVPPAVPPKLLNPFANDKAKKTSFLNSPSSDYSQSSPAITESQSLGRDTMVPVTRGDGNQVWPPSSSPQPSTLARSNQYRTDSPIQLPLRTVSAGAAELSPSGRRGSQASYMSKQSVKKASTAADLYEKLREALGTAPPIRSN